MFMLATDDRWYVRDGRARLDALCGTIWRESCIREDRFSAVVDLPPVPGRGDDPDSNCAVLEDEIGGHRASRGGVDRQQSLDALESIGALFDRDTGPAKLLADVSTLGSNASRDMTQARAMDGGKNGREFCVVDHGDYDFGEHVGYLFDFDGLDKDD